MSTIPVILVMGSFLSNASDWRDSYVYGNRKLSGKMVERSRWYGRIEYQILDLENMR